MPVRKPGADDARRGPGEYRLDRILERDLGPHQRAVALDDHQRRIDRLLGEHADSASIRWRICGVSRAFSTAVSARRGASSLELSSCAQVTGFVRQRADDLARAQFVCRIAHREIRRDRECLDPRSCVGAPRARSPLRRAASFPRRWQRGRPGCAPRAPSPRLPMPERSTMASSKPISSVHTGLKRFSTTALVASVVDTDTSSRRCASPPAAFEHRANRLADADRQVPRGGQRLGDHATPRPRAAPRR